MLLGLILAVVITASVGGQDGVKVKKVAEESSTHKTFILAIEVSVNEKPDQIKETFGKVLEEGNPGKGAKPDFVWVKDKVDLKEIDKATFLALQRFVRGGPEVDGANIPRRVRKQTNTFWEIDLGDRNAQLHSIILLFDKGKRMVVEAGKKKEGLTLTTLPFGRATLQGTIKQTPKSFKLIKFGKGDQPVDEKTVPEELWERPDKRYWLLKLEGWEGDPQKLIKVLGDEDVLVNPVVLSPELSLLGVGTFLYGEGGYPGGFTGGNKFTFQVPRPPKGIKIGATPKDSDEAKVWMLFPLSKNEAEDISKKLDNLTTGKLIAHINGKVTGKDVPVFERLEAGKEGKLAPGAKARWIELPLGANKATFERTIPVEKIGDWWEKEKSNKSPRSFRIIVVEVRKKGKKAADALFIKGTTHNKVEEVPEWFIGLQQKALTPTDTKPTNPK